MAGKRLLDAAKLFNVGRSIAQQHVVLRQQQWDVYSKTSSLAKAVKSQTDRVTVTAGAAYELAKRFGDTAPAWQEPRQDARSEEEMRAERRREKGLADSTIGQDERPGQNAIRTSTTGQVAATPDTRASLDKRKSQRQSEDQIPAASAATQLSQERNIDEDSFAKRSEHVSSELSSLPRTKLPKHSDGGQEGLDTVGKAGINQDVFYTPGGHEQVVQEDDLPDGLHTQGAFSSPRVSSMLGRSRSDGSPYQKREKRTAKPLPEMLAAEEKRRKEREAQEHKEAQETAAMNTHADDPETQDLAASIAQDAEKPAPTTNGQAQPSTSTPYEMRESRVPSSRFGRLWQYSGLATSMAFGAVGESFRRLAGGNNEGSLMLSESNMNRLVAKLSRMRGAALKLGQMVSFQDSKMLPPTINAVLQRVQDSADYMPPSQRDQVLVENLGREWRELFSSFDEKPFAAASIGQVHKGVLASNGKDVAVKVQYPGVRNSIDSDLNNLSLLLTASRILPKGLFLDKTIANARTELAWECDYEREAEACTRFSELLADEEHTFSVPEVYTEASGPGVLTAQFMHGTAVTKMNDLSQHDRDWVGTHILRLCLRELMEWKFMQTDPNWTNFLYNRESQKLELLDFGASREFPDKFVVPYVNLLIAASKGDRDRCRDLSIELGYLTGRESKDMLRAHVDSVLTLAEPFVESAPEVYDFEDQTITDRVRENIGLMLRERLAPPPEETYSLHRKLSGAFLLCARLRSKVKARGMFADAVQVWEGRKAKVS